MHYTAVIDVVSIKTNGFLNKKNAGLFFTMQSAMPSDSVIMG